MTAQAKQLLVETAKLMIAGDLDLVEGCRKLIRVSRGCDALLSHPDLVPIVGFESETDDYPLGEVRSAYEKTYLAKLDQEIAEYSGRARPSVLKACQFIVAMYGEKNAGGAKQA
ncbi:hypothetical protein [Tardiphaga sp. P9-11]|uniref:hypothetical protein n=1 Tax=Tardiphaga sp. P9-11 TaxID=2024614 RepID=UPI0011F1DC13|nr:hypothetical protein [Tardiphaga sp. P9-11]KAA0076527.1 hypothetical protein CIW50_10005 [Tardiphaga sp. P9-11]